MMTIAVHTILLLLGMLIVMAALSVTNTFLQTVLVSLGCNLVTTTIVFAAEKLFSEK